MFVAFLIHYIILISTAKTANREVFDVSVKSLSAIIQFAGNSGTHFVDDERTSCERLKLKFTSSQWALLKKYKSA